MPAVLCWLLLVFLAVPTVALAQTEASPSAGAALLEPEAPPAGGTAAEGQPLDSYVAPPAEAPIEFEAAPATDGVVEPAPTAPAPSDPVTDPVPTEPAPTEPAGEVPPPATEPPAETPVDETPVGSVIENSPEQPVLDGFPEIPVYVPPAIQVPARTPDPLPAQVIPTEDLTRRAEAPAPAPAVATPAPPAPAAAPIERPPAAPASRADTIPAASFSAPPARPAPAISTGKHFTPGLGTLERPAPPASSPVSKVAKAADGPDLPGAGVTQEEAYANPFQARLGSPTGPTPSGSQLLEVLAQYVIAGGSGPPTGVALILLVQIATMVVAFSLRTPRWMFEMVLGVPDKACAGYRAVALRPG